MSELKSETIYFTHENGDAYAVDMYLKSEADKVIAEKDEKIENLEEYIKELQKATDSAWSKVNAMYDELTHVKRKRCLAMAKWCYDRWIRTYHMSKLQKTKFYVRWQKRWLELAEKFKPNSTAQ